MSKFRKKVVVILCAVFMLLLIIIVYHVLIVPNIENGEEDELGDNKVKTVAICKKGFQCGVPDAVFKKMVLDNSSSSKLLNKVNKINNRINQDYKKVLESNVSSRECLNIKNAFNHSIYITDTVYVFDGSNYTVLSLISVYNNLCNDSVNSEDIITFFYNKKHDKFLSQEEFLKEIGLNSSMLEDVVQNDLLLSQEQTKIDKSKDYLVYVMDSGDVMVSYYTDNINIGHSTYTNIRLNG